MASNHPVNQFSDRRAPWWACIGPACAFVFFLAPFWPRPYALPAGDGLAYYSGARRVVVTLFILFCCARFSIARQYLWYGTSLGFFVQQALLAFSLIGGLLYLHRVVREFWRNGNRVLPHAMAIVVCGIVAAGLWRFGHTPKPAHVFAPRCPMVGDMFDDVQAHRRIK